MRWLTAIVAAGLFVSGATFAKADESDWFMASSMPYAARYKAVNQATQEAASGRWKEALALLDKATKMPPDPKKFLQAQWLLRSGSTEKARELLKTVASSRGALSAYAAWILASSLQSDCSKAMPWAEEALQGAGIRPQALQLLTDCLIAQQRPEDAAGMFRQWLVQIPSPEARRQLAVRFGRLLLMQGDKAAGLTLLTESWVADSSGKLGVEGDLKAFYGEDWPTVALFKALAEGGRSGVSQAARLAPDGAYYVALLQGASSRASRNKQAALDQFEMAVAKAQRPLQRALALYLKGRALESLDRDLEGRDLYGELLKSHPDFPAAHSLWVRMGLISLREGLGADAAVMLQRYLDGATPGEQIAEGLWQLAFVQHLQGRETQARKLLEQLESQFFYYTRSSWEYYGPQARYWQSICLQAEGRERAATERLQALAHEFPSNYYGLLALKRGGTIPGIPQPAAYEVSPLQVPQELRLPDSYIAAVELFRLGMWEMAYQELVAQMGLGNMAKDVLVLMTSAYFRTHSVDKGVSLRREIGLLPAPWQTGARLWRSSLRIGFVDAILGAARKSGLDSALLAAVIRFESDYSPALESHAGAVGLIQVKTNAGSDISQTCLGGGSVTKKELRDPVRNLILGSLYISELVFRHHGNWAVALAAFNAGPGTARWWLGRFGGLQGDEFIEQLTFPNAIGYVKRILGVVNIYWSLFYPLLGEAAPQAGLPAELPRDLRPFLEEEGGRCKSLRPDKSGAD